MMRGGADWWAQLAAGSLAAGALLWAGISGPAPIPTWVSALWVVTVWIGVQLLPLPGGILKAVSPTGDALSQASLSPLGLYLRARPVSLDSAAGLVELAKAMTCTLAALATVLVIRRRGARRVIWRALALSGTAAAMIGLGSASVRYGDGAIATGPFVNPNHQAGFLNLCGWPALGLALDSSGPKRGFWLTCYVVIGLGIFLTLSRGGIGGWIAALVVFAILHATRGRAQRGKHWIWVAGGVSAVVFVAGIAALDRVFGKLASVPLSRLSTVDKIAAWPSLLKLMARFPLVGIGRGAFATTFPAFKAHADRFTWTHAENEWLQIPIEIGVPAAILLIVSFGWIWLRASQGRELSNATIGVLSGMAGLVLHNIVDFSLEMLGVALPFAVAAASLSRSEPGFRVSRVPIIAGASVCGLLSVACLVLARPHSLESEAASLSHLQEIPELEDSAKRALAWHPVDYLPHLIVGSRLATVNDCSGAKNWLSRAMLLNPTAPEAHLYLGQCLARQGAERTALREFRLAYLFGRGDALTVAMEHYKSVDALLTMVPVLPDSLNDLAARLADQRRLNEAQALFERVWASYGDLVALARLGDISLELGQPEDALRWTRLLHERDRRWLSGYLVGSKALRLLGDSDQARVELLDGLQQLPGNPDLALAYGGLLIQDRQFAEARRVLAGTATSNPREAARLHQMISNTLEGEGRISEALREMISARDSDPGNVQVRTELARLMAANGH